MIRSSSHSTNTLNTGKFLVVDRFVSEYRKSATKIVDYIWGNGYEWKDNKGNGYEFNVGKNLLNTPSMLTSDIISRAEAGGVLTGRALKCCLTQVAGMVGAACEKQRKRLYILGQGKGSSRKNRKQLVKKIKQNIPQKPDCSRIQPELNSICMDIQEVEGEFQYFIRLKSIFKDKTETNIPVKMHKRALKWKNIPEAKLCNSILLGEKSINLRWEVPDVPLKSEGRTVGADQGMKDVLTCSDGQTTPKIDKHGHTLEKIMDRMCRKRSDSKAMERAQEQRENFINWSINQLSFEGINKINLEKIWNIGYRKTRSAKMSHWTNTLIRDKVEAKAQEHGVRVQEQSSIYRSQRCSGCGMVRKANRKGKVYECRGCGLEIDSDFNASLNHEISLPEIPWTLRERNLNRGTGFYWKPHGLFDCEGRSLQSLPPVED